uniref:Putative salivary secreted peptide n=1 Tax=Anopheles funestus TaxID=62324 RepID=Q06DH5_ANOFN|nr:putative salivary secreted peptide [Anopheles funestus]
MKGKVSIVALTALFFVVNGAPVDPDPAPVSKAIALIHHLTYLIDYLVQYIIGSGNDRKTPQEAADYYQNALVEGKNPPGQGCAGSQAG